MCASNRLWLHINMAFAMKKPVSPPHLTQRALSLVTDPSLWQVIGAVLMAVVGYLAFTPEPPPSADLGWDKLNHSSAFAAMAFAACFSFPRSLTRQCAGLACVLAYGGLIEIVQLYIPGRTGEWADLLADALGIGAGAAVALFILRWFAAKPVCHPATAGQGPRRAG